MALKPRNETIRRVVIFEGDASNFNTTLKQIQAASAAAAGSLKQIDRATRETASSLSGIQASLYQTGAALKLFGGVFIAQEIYRYTAALVGMGLEISYASDRLVLLGVRLSRLGDGADNFGYTNDLAERLGVTVSELGDQVALLSPAFQKLGLSFAQVGGFAENLILSMRVFGTDVRRAQIVTVQLAQALSSGQFSGDELRSLAENAGGLGYEFEKAVQAILGTSDSMKILGSQGRLTTSVVMRAFNDVFNTLKSDFAKLPATTDQALARVENSWERLKVAIDRATGASEKYKGVLGGLSAAFNDMALEGPGELNRKALSQQDSDAMVRRYVETIKTINELNKTKEELESQGGVGLANSIVFGDRLLRIEKELEKYTKDRVMLQVVLADRAKDANAAALDGKKIAEDTTAALEKQREAIGKIQKAYREVETELNPVLKVKDEFDEKEIKIFEGSAGKDIKEVIALIDQLREARKKALEDAAPAGAAIAAVQKLGLVTNEQLKRLQELAPAFQAVADKWKGKVPVSLLLAVANQESGFKQFNEKTGKILTSTAGAMGVMQLMPGTMRDIAAQTGIATKDMMDTAAANIDAGAFYIKQNLERFGGDITKTVAGYNMGPHRKMLNVEGPIDPAKIPFKETRDYVANVLSMYARLSAALGDVSVQNDLYKNSVDAAAKAEESRVYGVIALEQENTKLSEILKTIRGNYDSLLASLDPLTAAEQAYAAGVDIVTMALRTKKATIEEASLAMDLLMKKYQEAAKEAAAAAGGLVAFGIEVKGTLEQLGGSWLDSAVEGTFRLKDAVKDLIKELVKLALKMAITTGVNRALGLTGSAAYRFYAKGDSFGSGTNLAEGVYTSPTVFKFARGGRFGLMGEAGPEAVMPLARTSSGDLGIKMASMANRAAEPPVINIINQVPGAEVQTRTTPDGDIEVVIARIIKDVSRGGNATSRAFENTYALNRAR